MRALCIKILTFQARRVHWHNSDKSVIEIATCFLARFLYLLHGKECTPGTVNLVTCSWGGHRPSTGATEVLLLSGHDVPVKFFFK